MARPTEIRPGTPTEEIRLHDGWASPLDDERAVGMPSAASQPAAGETARIGGGRRTLAVGVGLLGLVLAVAGAGFAGRTAAPPAAEPPAAGPADAAEPASDSGDEVIEGAPDGAVAADQDAVALAASVDFPVEVDGLLVQRIDEVGRPTLKDGARPFAVAGWLSVDDVSPADCLVPWPTTDSGPSPTADATPGADPEAGDGTPTALPAADPGAPSGPTAPSEPPDFFTSWPPGTQRMDPRSRAADFCHRLAVLRAAPGAGWQTGHLHPQLLPGLALGALPHDEGGGVPVVLIAHHNDARAVECLPAGRLCGHGLVVDRVAWAAGRDLPRSLAIAPGLHGENRRSPARAGSIVEFFGTVPLRTVSVAGVAGADLRHMDPDAAAMVAGGDVIPELAWYVRFIVPDAVNGRVNWTTGWAVVDDATGRVVARAFG